MNKALIPAFFLLGSLILGVSIMVPQFANAQGEQKVNSQQLQALKLFSMHKILKTQMMATNRKKHPILNHHKFKVNKFNHNNNN